MNCCVFSDDYDDGPSCFKSEERTARKEHHCGECGKPIAKGEQYLYESGIWDGSASSFKTCLACRDVREHFVNACSGVDDDGFGRAGSFVYGMVWQDIIDNFFPDMKAGGPCMTGMSPRAKAKMFEMYLEWYEDGEHDGAPPPPRPYEPNEGPPP